MDMKNLIYILVLLCPLVSANAQFCTGNVGDNIFLDGDFGSGSDNIVIADPGIAPGFFYNPVVPPYDGEYVITKDIGLWANSFNWLPIKENSDDPDGYMMVVNASFEPGLFYTKEVEGLCSNTLYEFTTDMINVIPPGSNSLKPNVSFLLDGVEIISTGSIPEDAQWHTYGFTFTTEPDQTSLTLSLRNNAPGGFGNDLAIDNISFRACGPEAFILPEATEFLCLDGQPMDLEITVDGEQYDTPTFQWQESTDEGLTWNDLTGATGNSITHSDFSSGFYYYRFLVANNLNNLENDKCRVNSNTKVVRILPEEYEVVDSICDGGVFEVGNKTYTESGIYIDTLTSFYGCDSIMTLNLSVMEDPDMELLIDFANPSCSYSFDGYFEIDTVLNGEGPFFTLVNDEVFEEPWIESLINEGSYSIKVFDRYGCETSALVEISKPDSFVIDLVSDQNIELGQTAIVQSLSNYEIENFQWSPPGLIDCVVDCDNQVVLFTQDTMLVLEGVNEAGCVARDTVLVQVDQTRKVFFPNIISADNDGINDVFMVYGAVPNVQLIRSLKIFDRWGAMVFERSDLLPGDESSGWNPLSAGGDYESGVFVYTAEVEFLDGTIAQYSGSFTLNN